MTTTNARLGPAPASSRALGVLAAAHAGPALAVTVVAALLAVSAELPVARGVTVTAAVLAGQLTIGWGNDLLDVGRDRVVGRADKPLATGAVPVRWVQGCLTAAAVACVVLSVALGWRAALVHLLLGVGMGQAYNLGLKATAWSWAPYAVAFGTLPAVVLLSARPPHWPAWWLLAAGALLGVGAHLLNTLPDLADDARTGVRGLPHRLGGTRSRLMAALLLALASTSAAFGPAGHPPTWVWAVLAVSAALAAVAVAGRGRLPFRAAMAVALLDVALLVAAGR